MKNAIKNEKKKNVFNEFERQDLILELEALWQEYYTTEHHNMEKRWLLDIEFEYMENKLDLWGYSEDESKLVLKDMGF